jgi:hypothetical protein
MERRERLKKAQKEGKETTWSLKQNGVSWVSD